MCSLNPHFSVVPGSFFAILFGIGSHHYPSVCRSHSGPQVDHSYHITNELPVTENLSGLCNILGFFFINDVGITNCQFKQIPK